jgi:hypothetical protein
MKLMNSDEELNKKAEEIEVIYKEALARLNTLKEEQSKVIESFINALKEKRLAELRGLISGQKTE